MFNGNRPRRLGTRCSGVALAFLGVLAFGHPTVQADLLVPDPPDPASKKAGRGGSAVTTAIPTSFRVLEGPSGATVPYADLSPQTGAEWPESLATIVGQVTAAVRLMAAEPDFTFAMPAAAVYHAIERNEPHLFESMGAVIDEGRLEVVGGRWCQADTQLISGESHVRQLLYGQRYFREKFHMPATVGWEPSTPGYAPSWPQILKLAGIEYLFVSCDRIDDYAFRWEGIDGSHVLVINQSANPHGGKGDAAEVKPNPEVSFSKAHGIFARLFGNRGAGLSTYHGSLNSNQTGRFTTNGHIKRLCRKAESKLVSAEAIAAIASLSGFRYPLADFGDLWRELCFHQHHEILGGACIGDSYDYSRVALSAVSEKADWITRAAMRHIATRLPVGDRGGLGGRVLVANPLGFGRSGLAAIPLPRSASSKSRYRVTSSDGTEVAWQIIRMREGIRMYIWAQDVPAFGYDTYRIEEIAPADKPGPHESHPGLDKAECRVEKEAVRMENGYLRILINKTNGQLVSVFDKVAGREVLEGSRPGNVFEAHFESPAGRTPDTFGEIVRVEAVDNRVDTTLTDLRPLQARVRVTWRYGDSTIFQHITLTAGSPRIDFETRVRWKELTRPDKPSPILLVTFPLVSAGEGAFRYSVPFGDEGGKMDGIDVPALTWAALAGPQGGAALLSDSKHGFSVTSDGRLRLTLVRSSGNSDPSPDLLTQNMTYSLLPVGADYSVADLTREGFSLNHPLVTYQPARIRAGGRVKEADRLPERFGALDMSSLRSAIPTCLKLAEDRDGLILRMYQSRGLNSVGILWANFPVESAEEVNLLEDRIKRAPSERRDNRTGLPVGLRGYEIRTYKIKPTEAAADIRAGLRSAPQERR